MSETQCHHRGYDYGNSFLSLEFFNRADLHPVHSQPINQQPNLLHLSNNHATSSLTHLGNNLYLRQ